MGKNKKKDKKTVKGGGKCAKQVDKKMKRLVNQPSSAQKMIITQYLIDHPDFARNTANPKAMKQHWKSLLKLLHEAGPVRELKKWKKTMSDKKKNLFTKWSTTKVFSKEEDQVLAKLLYEDIKTGKTAVVRKKKQPNDDNDSTSIKKKKLENSNTSGEDADMQKALQLSLVHYAIENIRTAAVHDGASQITPEMFLALITNTTSVNINPAVTHNAPTTSALVKDQMSNNGSYDNPQPSTSREIPATISASFAVNLGKENNNKSTESDNSESEDSDESNGSDNDDDNDETESSTSGNSSDEDQDEYELKFKRSTDEKAVYKDILVEQRKHNAQMLSTLQGFMDWCKQLQLPLVQASPEFYHNNREGMPVQMIFVENPAEQVARVPEGAATGNEDEDENDVIADNPDLLKKYLP